MFGIGFPELVIILVIIVLVVGPEELPGVVRKGVAFVREARRHLAEIKAAVDRQSEPLREPLDAIRQSLHSDAQTREDKPPNADAPSGDDTGTKAAATKLNSQDD